MKRSLVVAIMGILALATPAASQVHLGFNAGLSQYTGNDFEDAEMGVGFGTHLLFGKGDTRFGFGGNYARHGEEGFDEKTTTMDLFGILRYMFPGESARFFIGGQGGFTRVSAEILSISLSANGFTGGPVLGVQIPLSTLFLELAGDLRYVKLGDVESEGETFQDSDSSGMIWGFKLGISIPVGG